MKLEVVRRRIAFLVAFCAAAVTLLISPGTSLDPINLIKILALGAIGFALIPLTIIVARHSKDGNLRLLYLIALAFVGWMLIVVLVTDSPVNQQIWGVFGRNTGMFTYFSLTAVLVAAATVQLQSRHALLVRSLLFTSIPVLVYAIIQTIGRDPVAWSQMAPFGTLGNINFSSAFFGMSAVAMTAIAIGPNLRLSFRLLLIALVVIKIMIVGLTGSIQGLMIYVAGTAVALYFFVVSKPKLRSFRIPYLALSGIGFLSAGAGLLNQGPLARFIFGETVLFRYDYWYAGWMMTLRNPVFGVGLDSYGDWYRELRGEVATLRTVPDRITNSAHNIYLDISAGGGFPLLFLYLAMLGLAFASILGHLRQKREFDTTFVVLASVWVAYVVQAGISINQVGVGVWGWAITGALIGYRRQSVPSERRNREADKKLKSSTDQLPVIASLSSILSFAIGFSFAFIPYQADARIRDAQESGSLSSVFSASKSLGATAYHLELALDLAIQANDVGQAQAIMNELLVRYPRDFMAWRVKQTLATSTLTEREEAYRRLLELDPYNPDIKPFE